MVTHSRVSPLCLPLFSVSSEGSEAGRRVLDKAKVHRRALEALSPPSAGRGAPLVQSYQGEGKGEGSASPSPLLLCVRICRQYVDRAHVYFFFSRSKNIWDCAT